MSRLPHTANQSVHMTAVFVAAGARPPQRDPEIARANGRRLGAVAAPKSGMRTAIVIASGAM